MKLENTILLGELGFLGQTIIEYRLAFSEINGIDYNRHLAASQAIKENGFTKDGLRNYDSSFYQHNCWFPGPITDPF